MLLTIALNRMFPFTSQKALSYAVISCLGILPPHALAEVRHHTVFIEAMRFTPSVLEVNQGDTIEWINKDLYPHNAVADTGIFRSAEMAAEESWQWRANKRGTISYTCTLHPAMKAKLIVKEVR
jgi:plastocyanin